MSGKILKDFDMSIKRLGALSCLGVLPPSRLSLPFVVLELFYDPVSRGKLIVI